MSQTNLGQPSVKALHIIFNREITDVKDATNKFRDVTFYDVYHVGYTSIGLAVVFTPGGDEYLYPWNVIGRVKVTHAEVQTGPAANDDNIDG